MIYAAKDRRNIRNITNIRYVRGWLSPRSKTQTTQGSDDMSLISTPAAKSCKTAPVRSSSAIAGASDHILSPRFRPKTIENRGKR